MANNRMFLIHRPSGLGIGLGKRGGYGWRTAGRGIGKSFDAFYDYIAENPESDDPDVGQDDFILYMEIHADGSYSDWHYTGEEQDGYPIFTYKPDAISQEFSKDELKLLGDLAHLRSVDGSGAVIEARAELYNTEQKHLEYVALRDKIEDKLNEHG